MRFHKLVWVALGTAAVLIIAVCILPFLIGDDLAFLSSGKAKYKVWLTSGNEEAASERASESAGQTPLARRAEVTGRYCLIGDSRTKGLNQVCGLSQTEHFYVVAEVGMGYSWMMSTALPEAASTGLNDYVLLLGVNDLENAEAYLAAYRNLVGEGKRITLATVGPVEEGKGGYSVTNYEIDVFNERLSEVEGARVIDLNAYLWKNDFSTMDGVHYTDDTYRLMEEFLLTELD